MIQISESYVHEQRLSSAARVMSDHSYSSGTAYKCDGVHNVTVQQRTPAKRNEKIVLLEFREVLANEFRVHRKMTFILNIGLYVMVFMIQTLSGSYSSELPFLF